MMKIIFQTVTPPGIIAAITIISTSEGSTRNTSLILIKISSLTPPQWPLRRPKRDPNPIATPAAVSPTNMEILVPYRTLLSTSFPRVSVPSQCSVEGGVPMPTDATSSKGSYACVHPPISDRIHIIWGANTAIPTNASRIARPTIPSLLPLKIRQVSFDFFKRSFSFSFVGSGMDKKDCFSLILCSLSMIRITPSSLSGPDTRGVRLQRDSLESRILQR